MPLTALDVRPGPASSVPNVPYLPEACPNHEKSPFSWVIDPVLEHNFSVLFMKHRRKEPNRSSQPRFLSSPAMIENP